jgi:hypothetical protein
LVANGSVNFGPNAGTNGPAPRTLASISLGTSGVVSVQSSASHSNRTVLITSGLTFAGTLSHPLGTLDLADNDMIVTPGDEATVFDALASGFNASSGYWNGSGIQSTAAAMDSTFLTTLGYRTGGNAFDNQNTSSADILVKYTYYGDADLSGTVDGADYHQIDLGFAGQLAGWSNGDFNYDGVVDGADYALIDNTFNQIATLGAGSLAIVADPTAEIAPQSTIAVPEPASAGLLLFAAAAALARRRQRTTKR